MSSRLIFGLIGMGVFVTSAVIAAPKLKVGGNWSKAGTVKPEEARKRFKGALGRGKEILEKDKQKREEQHKGCAYGDQPSACTTPTQVAAEQINIDRSLFIHDSATIDESQLTLRAVMTQLAKQAESGGAVGVTASSLFQEFWDTQNPATPATQTFAHCDDNGQTVNGFPVSCRPGEGQQTADAGAELDKYRAIGLVNRLDLAHEGWSNCGEHRIVFGRNDGTRNFMIFEAVLPNPKPGCRSGCRPVAEFWAGLSDPALTPKDMGKALNDFYLKGLPGFRPVVHIDHYAAKAVDTTNGSSGSGQIRTNQFLQRPWLLKEFSLVLDCGATPCALQVVPTMVKGTPFGSLWSEEMASDAANPLAARAAEFQAALLNQVGGLSGKQSGTCPTNGADVTRLGYSVNALHDAAESSPQPNLPDNFLTAFDPNIAPVSGLFRESLQNSPDLCGLTPTQVINRATALSCAGCHQPQTFGLRAPGAIGPVTLPGGAAASSWPNSLGFVHTAETADSNGVYALSEALTTAFLPARRNFLLQELNTNVCECDRSFKELDAPKREKALQVQAKVDSKFKARRIKEWQQIYAAKRKAQEKKKAVGFKDVKQGVKNLDEISRQQEAELREALKKEGVEVSSANVSLKVHSWKLDAARRAGGDKKKERELRASAVVEQIRSEPPRRTVTGSFRVH